MPRATLKHAARSEAGPQRDGNEDFAAVEVWPIAGHTSASDCLLAVIADGMGGHEAGEVASCLAVRTVQETVGRALKGAQQRPPDLASLLQEAVQDANEAVWRAAQNGQGRPNMGTTLTAVLVCGNEAHVAHVGDTRAYLIDGRGVTQITRDQSVVQDMVDAGVLTPIEARHSALRNQLTQALGTGPEVVPSAYTVRLAGQFDLILTTDGVHGSLVEEDFADALARHIRPQLMSQDLIDRAKVRDGSDNLTVIWVHGRPRSRSAATDVRLPALSALMHREVALPSLLGLVVVLAVILGVSLHRSGYSVAGTGGAAAARTPITGDEVLLLEAVLRDRTLTVRCQADQRVVLQVNDGQKKAFEPHSLEARTFRVAAGKHERAFATQSLSIRQLKAGQWQARLKLFPPWARNESDVAMAGRGLWKPVKAHVYEASLERWPVPAVTMRFSDPAKLVLQLAFESQRPAEGKPGLLDWMRSKPRRAPETPPTRAIKGPERKAPQRASAPPKPAPQANPPPGIQPAASDPAHEPPNTGTTPPSLSPPVVPPPMDPPPQEPKETIGGGTQTR